MTDERLIAAKAWIDNLLGGNGFGSDYTSNELDEWAAELVAVFEKAHTPTDDERGAGWSHPDAVYSPEVFMAMQELLNEAKGSPTHALRLAVSRHLSEPQGEPSDAAVDAGAQALFDEILRGSSIGDVHGTFERCRNSARLVLRAASEAEGEGR